MEELVMEKSKSEKLMEKINLLADKIENEKNPIKRTLYSIKAKMVIAKLDREIEIQNLKEQYGNEIADRSEDAKYEKIDTRSGILKINNRIREIERQLNTDRAYDPNSREFMFGQGEIENNGGVNEYAEILRASGRPDQIQAAGKMQEMQALREELNSLKDELEERKNGLGAIDFETEEANRKSERKMNALVLKTNTWTRVTDWFKSIGAGLKEAFTGNKIVTEAYANKKETKSLNRSKNKEKKRQIKQNYKQTMKELKETYKASQKNANQNAKMVKQNAKSEALHMQAEEIRDALDQRASNSMNEREGVAEEVKIKPISKDKNIYEMPKKESKFRDFIRVDNEDGHIENSASRALKEPVIAEPVIEAPVLDENGKEEGTAQVIEDNDPER